MQNAWIYQYVCPLLGTVICNVMWLSPLKAMLIVRKTHNLNNINPFPFGVTVVNCIAWTIYGVLRQDYFIFFSNFPGLILGLYYSITALSALAKPYATEKEQNAQLMLELTLLGGVAVWCMIGLIIGVVIPSTEYRNGVFAVGVIGCMCGMAYYSSPLSTMLEIIRLKDSSSLYLPTLMTNMVNALLWLVYGLIALNDPLVWGPNVVGILLTLSQLSLYVMFYPVKVKTVDGGIVLSTMQTEVVDGSVHSVVSNPMAMYAPVDSVV